MLDGGKALVALTSPSFVLEAGGEEQALPFHPASPAGKLFQVMPGQKRQNIRWTNPWKNQGGFGASSAEFVGMFLAHESTMESSEEIAWHAWKIFRLMTAKMKTPPSGADVLAQAWGTAEKISSPTIVAIDLTEKRIDPMRPTLGLTFELVHTGEKLPTHEHLAETLPAFPAQEANRVVSVASAALEAGDTSGFVNAVKAYRDLLQRTEREAPHTKRLIDGFLARDGVLAAKGCGAMGSDVVFVVSRKGSGHPTAAARWEV